MNNSEILSKVEFDDFQDANGRILKRQYRDGSTGHYQYGESGDYPIRVVLNDAQGSLIETRDISYNDDGEISRDITRDSQGKALAFEITNYIDGYITTVQRMTQMAPGVLETDHYIHDLKQGAVTDIKTDQREVSDEEVEELLK